MAEPSDAPHDRSGRELEKDAEAAEEAHDPPGLGLDPDQGSVVREIGEKRTRS
jgi:hypothetical protein